MSLEFAAPLACPYTGRRRTTRPGDPTLPAAPRVEQRDGVWHVRALPAVKDILQAGRSTRQAGFSAEFAAGGMARRPILYADGAEHRTQRAKIARFFAPRTVDRRYREFMERRADDIVARIAEYARVGDLELGEATMRYSVEVAAQVLGLGEADMPGMARRLGRFFSLPSLAPGERTPAKTLGSLYAALWGPLVMNAFYRQDVRPAVEARRVRPREDVISHLIAEGYSDQEILIECITYGAAGMVTTKEFLVVAAWHLLDDPALLARYLADTGPTGEADRYAVLTEILRLEPVVGHLFRRTTESLMVHDGDDTFEVPAGVVVDLSIAAANADPDHVGEDPLSLCPGRDLPPRIGGEAMTFGDGAHACPGQHLAIQESDVFLTRLLSLPLRITGRPHLGWSDLIQGYEVRGLTVRVDGGTSPT